ncbi:MAG: helix-turn-helix transcriptional regulator [Methanobrevibacter sp.]|nr:helix-turn-helix transcriptional regulator [Methanobrevibacter sp.]
MLGDKIKLLRTTAKLTQEEFAEKLGVSQQAIGLWERNKNLPNQKLLIKIAKFFNVTLDYLFDENINTNKIIFTPDEIQLIENFRLLKPDNQKNIINNINFLISQQSKPGGNNKGKNLATG